MNYTIASFSNWALLKHVLLLLHPIGGLSFVMSQGCIRKTILGQFPNYKREINIFEITGQKYIVEDIIDQLKCKYYVLVPCQCSFEVKVHRETRPSRLCKYWSRRGCQIIRTRVCIYINSGQGKFYYEKKLRMNFKMFLFKIALNSMLL